MSIREPLALTLVLTVISGCGDESPGNTPSNAAESSGAATEASDSPAAQDADNPLSAPPGFQVGVYHDGIGASARHLVVRDNGDVLVARRDGMLVGLRDRDGDGRADVQEERRLPITTGLAVHDGMLYFSDDVSVSRLPLDDGLLPQGEPQAVVSGFPEQGSHAAKTIALDGEGNLYVNVGAPSNACQAQARTPGSPGQRPCPQLERQAAIWRFPPGASGLDQSDGERFVTGVRNVVAMDWDPAAQGIYFAMHGRDQLSGLWPDYFDDAASAEMPAEEFHRAERGADYGWPYTFYDPRSARRLVAPEYGGDGEAVAEAGRYRDPLYAFPAHWAPNGLRFYHAAQFPERYRGGVFIAWRGSWNRAPLPQDGYRVTFLPFADGAPSGAAEDFLTGFKGAAQIAQPGEAAHRPMGLDVAPDGALFVSDTEEGRIWRVSYADGQPASG
ncbi:MAG: PQQ-dependent sugar dehydrogenase [Pseudomonadales bacterium]